MPKIIGIKHTNNKLELIKLSGGTMNKLSSIVLCLILIAGTAVTCLAVSAGSHPLLPGM
jgi:hypothetical protein